MLKALSDWGYGLTVANVQSIVREYLEQTNQKQLFKSGKPSRDWWYGFSKRWKHEISLRKADNISSNRAASCTDEIVNHYFETCAKQFALAQIDSTKSSHVWNCDETGFSGDQGKMTIVSRRGARRPLKLVGNNEKINYTVQNCCNASGYFMPPFIVYKAKNRLYNTWCSGGPQEAVYTSSPSGWMEKDQFHQWLINMFVPQTKKIGGCHILVLDGHNSHVTLRTVETCLANQIILICLPAHSSHILQPLDVGVYGHVKRAWRRILNEFYETTNFKNLDKENFPSLLKKLYDDDCAFTRLHAIAGFHNSGLYPLDKQNVDKEKLRIAKTFSISVNAAPALNQTPSARQ
jgi:hypothetical protein